MFASLTYRHDFPNSTILLRTLSDINLKTISIHDWIPFSEQQEVALLNSLRLEKIVKDGHLKDEHVQYSQELQSIISVSVLI